MGRQANQDELDRIAALEEQVRALRLATFGVPSSGGADDDTGKSITLTHPASITSVGGDNYVPLSSIEYDSSGGALWSLANPDRLLAPVTGNYALTANWGWYPITFATSAQFSATLDKNGAGTAAGFDGWDFSAYVGGSSGGNTGFATTVAMSAGDYLRIDVIDAAGGGHQIQKLRVGWALL